MRLEVKVFGPSELGPGRAGVNAILSLNGASFGCQTGDDTVRLVVAVLTQGVSTRERAFKDVLGSAVHACSPRFHSSLLEGSGDDINRVSVVCRCSATKRVCEGKGVVAVHVGDGVTRPPCFDAAAYIQSGVSHGQTAGDGHGDTPAFRCEEDFRAAKDRACKLDLATREPGFAAMVIAGHRNRALVKNPYTEPLSLVYWNIIGHQDSRSEAADWFIKYTFGCG